MHVSARVYASLQQYAAVPAGTPIDLDLPQGATVTDLLRCLKVPADAVRLVFVNGRARPEDWPLVPEDEIGVFPPIGGG